MIYFTINKHAETPLYQQIINQVQDKLSDRTVKHMDKLPSEKQFSEIYHVSSFVVKRAYSELRKLGLVFSVKGRGTFVSHRLVYEVDLFHSLDLIDPAIRGFDHKFLSVEKIDFTDAAYRMMGKKQGENYLKVTWVALNNQIPIAFMISLLPEAMAEDITYVIDNKKTIRQYYLDRLPQVTYEQSHTLNAANADENLAYILDIEVNDPVTIIQTVVDNGTAYFKTIYPGEYLRIKAV